MFIIHNTRTYYQKLTSKACRKPAFLSDIQACNRKLNVSSFNLYFFFNISSTSENAVNISPDLPNAF